MDKIYTVVEKTLPLIPLRGVSIFPYMVIHFDVGREKSIQALEHAMMTDSMIVLSTQIDPKIDDPTENDFYDVGTVANVKQMLKLPGGSIRVLVEGLNRCKIKECIKTEPFFEVIIDEYIYNPDKLEKTPEIEAAMRLIINDLEDYLALNPKISQELLTTVEDIEDPGRFADVIASYIFLKQEDDQSILEAFDIAERLEVLHKILQAEIELLRIEDKINQRVRKQISKVQKEYYLREQLKAIQKELGEEEDYSSEIEEYKEKIRKAKMSKEAEEKALKEVERLSKMPSYSAEVGVIRTYLDWLIDLPWAKETKEKIDIKKARNILDEDHFGLDDVKERILEFIAVKKLTGTLKGPILCLVGPPGVGKTSIAKSIAKALNRNFVRMSLGGVRDEAEIRGHRRTYVGSMPGRIISSIKKSGSKNPVFLLDEVDKLANDFRGDPASALLEVLDPEQNSTFTDHYLEVAFDLSKVMFITTANTTATIPQALLDRMEVIRIGGYTEEEKFEIARRHLIPKQLKDHGLTLENLSISDQALRMVISNYTREAGVRNLERNIANLCRKAAKKIVEIKTKKVSINTKNLDKYLGPPRFRFDTVKDEDLVGVVNGLAWTEVGGDTLSVEAIVMKGKGSIQLTGQLGDVMKESAMAGISYIRANAERFGIDPYFYKDYDIHIHVPEGAIPKDGPSAGVTMATAVISALKNVKVKKDVAMTGEITLRGIVLPVGGIKEKVLAAHRMGIKTIILPEDNKIDLNEISDKVKKNIEFVFVKKLDEVLERALLLSDGDKDESN
ncbi:MAG TPA: endopeptidase La [Soehngenia sp.]|nr:endopeptidase La [Soehngenia sp.]HPP31738.1 endopeptidase La [Soehngenia sp.]